MRLLLREEKKNEEESSAPEGVDERRREAREQAPRLQIHITCSASAEPPSHNTRAPASQRRTHQGRQATTTILKSHGLAEEDRTPQQRAVRVGSPAVRGPTPGHPTPRNPGRASAGASVVDQRHRTSSRLQQQGCPESVGTIGHTKIDTQIRVLTKSRNFLTKTKSSRRTDETWG